MQSFGLAETILLGIYFGGIMFNLFLLSVAGSNLTHEVTNSGMLSNINLNINISKLIET